jgi:hypothetical protein
MELKQSAVSAGSGAIFPSLNPAHLPSGLDLMGLYMVSASQKSRSSRFQSRLSLPLFVFGPTNDSASETIEYMFRRCLWLTSLHVIFIRTFTPPAHSARRTCHDV